MEKIRIGVIGPADIAYRRMVPAIIKSSKLEYAGIAHASFDEWPEQSATHATKCNRFRESYGGTIYNSIGELLDDETVDAVYIPLPPAAHYKWAMAAMEKGKHVLLEKPLTNSLSDTEDLINKARDCGLALHENYAYAFHRQISELENLVASGRLGELRMVRSSFSFPYRGENDFRYHKERGGGAIVDCGGYPVNLASRFLGNDVEVLSSNMASSRGHDVDTYGIATLKGDKDVTAQISWGTDNTYRCNIELHGSVALATTERVFSPPADMKVEILIKDNSGEEKLILEEDDQFMRSAEYFRDCITDNDIREKRYNAILVQAKLIDSISNRR